MYNNAKLIKIKGQHAVIRVDINGVTSWIPLDPNNTDYRHIMELQEQNLLQIEAADEPTMPTQK